MSTFQKVADLGTSMKTDDQIHQMTTQLKPRIDVVFNPFTSKMEEDAGQIAESPHESDHELERD